MLETGAATGWPVSHPRALGLCTYKLMCNKQITHCNRNSNQCFFLPYWSSTRRWVVGTIVVKMEKYCLGALPEIRGKDKMAFWGFLVNLPHLLITAYLWSPWYMEGGGGGAREIRSPVWAPGNRRGSSKSVRLSMWLAQSFPTREWQSWTLNPAVYPGAPTVLPSDLWIWDLPKQIPGRSHYLLAAPRGFPLLAWMPILRPGPTVTPTTSAVALHRGHTGDHLGRIIKMSIARSHCWGFWLNCSSVQLQHGVSYVTFYWSVWCM